MEYRFNLLTFLSFILLMILALAGEREYYKVLGVK